MTEIIDDIHDQLTKAYMNYFKANEKFERNNSIRTHREARKWLREIRRLAKLRSDEIHIKHNTTRQTRKGHRRRIGRGKYHNAMDLSRKNSRNNTRRH